MTAEQIELRAIRKMLAKLVVVTLGGIAKGMSANTIGGASLSKIADDVLELDRETDAQLSKLER